MFAATVVYRLRKILCWGKIEYRTLILRMPLARQRGLSGIFLSVFIRVCDSNPWHPRSIFVAKHQWHPRSIFVAEFSTELYSLQ